MTGHKHSIYDGSADLYGVNGRLYLEVHSEFATLVHEEHKPIQVPQGNWEVRIQREYEFQAVRRDETERSRYVCD